LFNSTNQAIFCLKFEKTVVDAGSDTRWKTARQRWGKEYKNDKKVFLSKKISIRVLHLIEIK
jgi:hypothetical protein